MVNESDAAKAIAGIVVAISIVVIAAFRLNGDMIEEEKADERPVVDLEYRDILERRRANELDARKYYAGIRPKLSAYVKEIKEVASYDSQSRDTPAYLVLDDMSERTFNAYILSSHLHVVESLRRDDAVTVVCNEVIWVNSTSLSKCTVRKIGSKQ